MAQNTAKVPERGIEPAYYVHSVEKNYHEWGARVNMALNQNIGPKWVVYVLAGTFWRIFGNPQVRIVNIFVKNRSILCRNH